MSERSAALFHLSSFRCHAFGLKRPTTDSMNSTLRFGFKYDQYYDTISVVYSFQLFVLFFNAFLLHPVTIFLMRRSRKAMGHGIFWGYVVTEIAGLLYDIVFAFIRLYSVAPFSAFYFDGLITRLGLANRHILIILFVIWTAKVPGYNFVLLSMHQSLLAHTNSMWLLSKRTVTVIFTLISAIIVGQAVLLGFTLRESGIVNELIEQPELQWLLSRRGCLLVIGDFGQPQISREGLLKFFFFIVQCAGIVVVCSPFGAVFYHCLYLIRSQQKLAVSSKTQAMTRKLFRVFVIQLHGVTLCGWWPLCLHVLSYMFDFRFLPDGVIVVLRIAFLTLCLLDPTQYRLVYIMKGHGLMATISMIVEKLLRVLLRELVHTNAVDNSRVFSTRIRRVNLNSK